MWSKLKMAGILVVGMAVVVPNIAAFARETASPFAAKKVQKSAFSGEPLSFEVWKTQKIVDAQNDLARATNRLVLYKHEHAKQNQHLKIDAHTKEKKRQIERQQELTPGIEMRSMIGSSQRILLKMNVARLKKSVEFAQELTLQDYVVGYLSRFNNNPKALSAMAGHLTDAQIADLLKTLLNTTASSFNPSAPALVSKTEAVVGSGISTQAPNPPSL